MVYGQAFSAISFIFVEMKIGKIAEMTGITRDTIRLYEQMGLVKNVTRPHEYNNYKEYGEENVERIRLILMMKKFGMTLKECKMVLDKIEDNSYDLDFQQSFVKQKINEIDQQIKELKQLKGALKEHIDQLCNRVNQ